jgi:hypothetical protein
MQHDAQCIICKPPRFGFDPFLYYTAFVDNYLYPVHFSDLDSGAVLYQIFTGDSSMLCSLKAPPFLFPIVAS